MATLHINSVRGPLAPVFKGMFGSIEAIPSDPNTVLFTYDPAIAACSNSLSAVGMGRSMKLQKHEVTTIEASEGAVNAIKANLAQGLINRWERGYAQVMGSESQPVSGGLASELRLRATNGDPVAAEREVARTGIARLLATMTNIAPHWIQTKQQLWVGPNLMDMVNHSLIVKRTGVANIDMQAAPIQKVSESYESMPYAPLDQTVNVDDVDGWYDANVAIPLYLPVAQRNPVARLMQSIGFGRAADLTNEQAQLNEETLAIIQTTYVLRELIIDGAKDFCVDGQSLVEVQAPFECEHQVDDAHEDDDEDEDGGLGDSDATGSQPQRDRG